MTVNTVDTVFSVMTTELSDAKERTNISFLTKLDTFLLTSWSWLQVSLRNLLAYDDTNLGL